MEAFFAFFGALVGGLMTWLGVKVTLKNQRLEAEYDLKMKLFPSIIVTLKDSNNQFNIKSPILFIVKNTSSNHLRNLKVSSAAIKIGDNLYENLIVEDLDSLQGFTNETSIIAPLEEHSMAFKIADPHLLNVMSFSILLRIEYSDLSLKNTYVNETSLICNQTGLNSIDFHANITKNEIIDL